MSIYSQVNTLCPCLWHPLNILVFYAAQCLLLVYQQCLQKSLHRLICSQHQPFSLLYVEIAIKQETIRWKGNINNTSVIIFNRHLSHFSLFYVPKRLTWWQFSWENLQEIFVMLVVVAVVAFVTGGFCVSRILFLASGTPPWLLRPMKASTSSKLYSGYFRLLYFCQAFASHFLSKALRFWTGTF